MNKYTPTILLLSLLLSGCGRSSSTNNTTEPTTPRPTTPTTQPTTPPVTAASYPLFKVYGNQAYMNDDLDSEIVEQLNALTTANPQVDTLVMENVPGSLDDEANLKAAVLVREKNLNTLIPERGMVASGGTDFFLAGVERVIAPGALIGVHSWADSQGNNGGDLPTDHSAHNLYLEFYQSIGVSPDFYWYTLAAAPADGIHWMTQSQMVQYNMATRQITASEQAEVINIPAHFEQPIKDLFDRYTWLSAPNGKVINIFAQPQVSLAQLLRAKNTLKFYLTDTPTLNKTALANSMGDKNASLFIFKDQQSSEQAFNGALGSTAPAQSGQDLYATEIFVEGDSRYLAAQPNGRDATMEEVLHLTQAYGIAPAMNGLQTQLANQAEVALTNNIWNPQADQLAEWRAEGTPASGNSVSHEYFAAIVEAYFGLWQNQNVGMDGYTGNNRDLQTQRDAAGQNLVSGFVPPMITPMMEIDASFGAGDTFVMAYDAALSYTAKSQYLLSIRLNGSNASHISANAADNTLMGNTGNNHIDGKEGHDIYVVDGLKAEFTLIETANGWLLEDTLSARNGKDTLVNIEQIMFNDMLFTL